MRVDAAAAILHAAPDALICTDESMSVVMVNAAAERLLGVCAADAIGQPLARFVGPGGTSVVRADGSEIPVETATSECAIDGARFSITAVRDVALAQRSESRRQLEAKMEAVGQLASGVAHDFNNLLMVILGNLELLEMTRNDPAGAAELIGEVRTAAERGTALARQLLTFSRRSPPSRVPVDLTALIRKTASSFQQTLGERCQLTTDLAAGPCVVSGDAGQIEQALLNLVLNARDAIPAKGKVVIRVHTEPADPPGKGLSAPVGPGYARIEVVDTGTGMSDDTRRRAFDPFFTTKPASQGAGLGLAAVYGIAAQLGGSVEVAHTSPDGTVIAVSLPLSASAVEPERRGSGAKHRVRRATVLLVEDEPAVRHTLHMILTGNAFTVLEARDGREALAAWNENHDQIDVVLSDLRMPNMGGRALAAALHAEQPDLPILLMSGYDDEPASADHNVANATIPILQKPFSADDLLAAIEIHAGL